MPAVPGAGRREEGNAMIERRPTSTGRVELTFRLPADHPAEPVGVAGDFNGWEITPLVDIGGKLEATVLVETGRRYQFRYRTSDGRWFNLHAERVRWDELRRRFDRRRSAPPGRAPTALTVIDRAARRAGRARRRRRPSCCRAGRRLP